MHHSEKKVKVKEQIDIIEQYDWGVGQCCFIVHLCGLAQSRPDFYVLADHE